MVLGESMTNDLTPAIVQAQCQDEHIYLDLEPSPLQSP
jgi:hypothetical protein